ncbi:hypothetical protein [Candidatus Binatus sp.]|uniref:hypothetical protein n=1 Tax=Candidatus Binatus sp. TaxID=2811406 RepID=UPI003C76C873
MQLLAGSCRNNGNPILLTEYIARHELNSIQTEITACENQGSVTVVGLSAANPTYKSLLKRGVHKGGAEAIAWILAQSSDLRPLFVSADRGAIRAAKNQKLSATDVMGLIVEAIAAKVLSIDQARSALDVWNDPGPGVGKPPDYEDFDETLVRRRNHPPDYL